MKTWLYGKPSLDSVGQNSSITLTVPHFLAMVCSMCGLYSQTVTCIVSLYKNVMQIDTSHFSTA